MMGLHFLGDGLLEVKVQKSSLVSKKGVVATFL